MAELPSFLWAQPAAAVAPYLLDFAAGSYSGPAGSIADPVAAGLLSVSRASPATARRADGSYAQFTANQPRVTDLGLWLGAARTNYVNAKFDGGAVGRAPAITPVLSGGVVTGFTVTDAGALLVTPTGGVTGNLTVLFTGGGGSGAAATVAISNGVLTGGFTISAGGSGYTSAPAAKPLCCVGTLPAGMAMSSMPAGILWTVVDAGTVTDAPTGLPRLRLKIDGTAQATQTGVALSLSPTGSTTGTAPAKGATTTTGTDGDVWSGSAHVTPTVLTGSLPANLKLTVVAYNGGSGPGISVAQKPWIDATTTGSAANTTGHEAAIAAGSTTATRLETLPIYLSNPCTGVALRILADFVSGTTYGYTLDIVAPQLEKLPDIQARPSPPILAGRAVSTASAAASGTTLPVADASGMWVGQVLSGTGIPAGVTIASKSGNTLTTSAATTVASGATVTGIGLTCQQDVVSLSGALLALAQGSAVTLAARIGKRASRNSVFAISANSTLAGLWTVAPIRFPIMGANGGTVLLRGEAQGGLRSEFGAGAELARTVMTNWAVAANDATITWNGSRLGLASQAGGDYLTVNSGVTALTSVQLGAIGSESLDGYLERLTAAGSYTADLSAVSSITAEIVVYGAKLGGILAAIAAKSQGRSAVIVGDEREVMVGGMTTGGLSFTDYVTISAYGGMVRDFYTRCAAKAGRGDADLYLEGRVARGVLEDRLLAYGLRCYLSGGIDSVTKPVRRITRFTTASRRIGTSAAYVGPKTFSPRVVIGADYVGDVMPLAGISYEMGRQGNSLRGELLCGIGLGYTSATNGDPSMPVNIGTPLPADPWSTPGDPDSGALYPLSAHRVGTTAGTDLLTAAGGGANRLGDVAVFKSDKSTRRWDGSAWQAMTGSATGAYGLADLVNIQAYNFRIIITRGGRAAPFFPAGSGTDPTTFGFTATKAELFLRMLDAMQAAATYQGRSFRGTAANGGTPLLSTDFTLAVTAGSGTTTLQFGSAAATKSFLAGMATASAWPAQHAWLGGYGGTLAPIASINATTAPYSVTFTAAVTATTVTFSNGYWGWADLYQAKPGFEATGAIYDCNNNGGISSDFTGGNLGYALATPAARETMWREHINYTLMQFWALQYHADTGGTGATGGAAAGASRVPAALRTEALAWGWDAWNCGDNLPGDWPGDIGMQQLYVREGLRMLNASFPSSGANTYPLLNERDACGTDGTAPRSTKTVAVGSYGADRHHFIKVPYWISTGAGTGYWSFHGETSATVGAGGSNGALGTWFGANRMMPIPLEAIAPAESECDNYLTTFACAASSSVFGALRMEPTSGAIGHAAGVLAAMAVAGNVAVQSVAYGDAGTPGSFFYKMLTDSFAPLVADYAVTLVSVSGTVLTFASGYQKPTIGWAVLGTGIPAGAAVSATSATTVTVTLPYGGTITATGGAGITFSGQPKLPLLH